jgi:hypothetical protein
MLSDPSQEIVLVASKLTSRHLNLCRMLVKTPHASPFLMEERGSIFILDKAGKSTTATEYRRLNFNNLAAESGSHYRKGAHAPWLEILPCSI